jgi:hypothetical protein
MERGNGFVPSCLQSRSEDRCDAVAGRRFQSPGNCAEVSIKPKAARTVAYRVAHQGRIGISGERTAGNFSPAIDDARRIAELEQKIGQLTMENDFLKKALQHFREHHPPAVVNGGDACLKKSARPRRKGKP